MYSYRYDIETGGIILCDNLAQMSNEPRPVYASELKLLGMDKYWHFEMRDEVPYLWSEANNYIYRGTKIAKIKGGSLSEVTCGGEGVAEELCLEADGTWFSVQRPGPGEPRRLEVKAVCAYAGKEERGGKVRRTGVARHACVAAPGEFAREAVAAVGGVYDLSKVRKVHVGSDGEPWCKGIGSFLPKAESVGHLDPFHVNRAVSSCFSGPGAASAVLGMVWGGDKESAPAMLSACAGLDLYRSFGHAC